MKNLTIETGHEVTADVVKLDTKIVRFVAEDGRTMFEVRVVDGKSIEVRSINCCVVGNKLIDNRLLVGPHSSNSITIEAPEYDK